MKYLKPDCKLLIGIILTHWGRVTHKCVSKLIIIGSDNGLLPSRHQAIIWTNVGILLIWPLGANFSEILIEIHIFHSWKCIWYCCLKFWPFYLDLNVLTESQHWSGYWLWFERGDKPFPGSMLNQAYDVTSPHWVNMTMMTSSNGNIFHVTGHFCGEFTGELPAQRTVTRSFWCFLWSVPE